jgi:hypothetical protein
MIPMLHLRRRRNTEKVSFLAVATESFRLDVLPIGGNHSNFLAVLSLTRCNQFPKLKANPECPAEIANAWTKMEVPFYVSCKIHVSKKQCVALIIIVRDVGRVMSPLSTQNRMDPSAHFQNISMIQSLRHEQLYCICSKLGKCLSQCANARPTQL